MTKVADRNSWSRLDFTRFVFLWEAKEEKIKAVESDDTDSVLNQHFRAGTG